MPKKHRIQKLPKFYKYDYQHLHDILNQIEKFDPKSKLSILDNLVKNISNSYSFPYMSCQISKQTDYQLKTSEPYGCFRVRAFTSAENALADVNHIKRILVRPSNEIEDFGRCHRPGQRILYCSNHLTVAVAEVNAIPRQYFIVARFEQRSPKPLETLLVGVNPETIFNNPLFNPEMTSHKSVYTFDWQINKQKMVERWMKKCLNARIAGKKRRNYIISSAILDKLFFPENPLLFNGNQVEIDCVMYPSVKANLKSFNLAFRSEVAEKILEVINIFLIQLKEIKGDEYTFSPIANGKVDADGNITWPNVPRNYRVT